MSAPREAKILFSQGSVDHEMDLLNLSLGGIRAATLARGPDTGRAWTLEVGQRLKDLNLVFPRKGSWDDAQIDSSVVRNTAGVHAAGGFQCGIEFTQIHKDVEKRLTEFVYTLQRRLLKRRLILV